MLYLLLGLLQFTHSKGAATFAYLVSRYGYWGAVLSVCLSIAFLIAFIILVYFSQASPFNSPGLSWYRKGKGNHEHIWARGDMFLLDDRLGPAHCNHCKGFVRDGVICLVCGRCAHIEHIKQVQAQLCKNIVAHDSTLKSKPTINNHNHHHKNTIIESNQKSLNLHSPSSPTKQKHLHLAQSYPYIRNMDNDGKLSQSMNGDFSNNYLHPNAKHMHNINHFHKNPLDVHCIAPNPYLSNLSNRHEHQFVKGNLGLAAFCSVCKKPAGIRPTLEDFRCLWCDVVVHTECESKLVDGCSLGKHSDIIVPPECVLRISSRRVPSKKTNPRFKVNIPPYLRPLICVVNPSSGSQNSPSLLRFLYKYLNPVQIVDVSRENPEAVLRAFESCLPQCNILVCGGDGTVQWVLSILEKIIPSPDNRVRNPDGTYTYSSDESESTNINADSSSGTPSENKTLKPRPSWPAVAILPLGTGNDLARVLGWGGGWSGEDLEKYFLDLKDSIPVQLDRWKITVETTDIDTLNIVSNTKMQDELDEVHKELLKSHFLNGSSSNLNISSLNNGSNNKSEKTTNSNNIHSKINDSKLSLNAGSFSDTDDDDDDDNVEEYGDIDIFAELKASRETLTEQPPSPESFVLINNDNINSNVTKLNNRNVNKISNEQNEQQKQNNKKTLTDALENLEKNKNENNLPKVTYLPNKNAMGNRKMVKTLTMNNYFSVGFDASVALDFHKARQQNPQYFKNRFLNKVIYTFIGTKHQLTSLFYIIWSSLTELFTSTNFILDFRNLHGLRDKTFSNINSPTSEYDFDNYDFNTNNNYLDNESSTVNNTGNNDEGTKSGNDQCDDEENNDNNENNDNDSTKFDQKGNFITKLNKSNIPNLKISKSNGSSRRSLSRSSTPPPKSPGSPLLSSNLFFGNKQHHISDFGGVIVLNIPSYGGGAKIYATAEAEGKPKCLYDDKKLQVVGVANPLHLGASVVGLSSPVVIGTGNEISFHIEGTTVGMQVDGEPWLQEGPCIVTISYYGQAIMLKRRPRNRRKIWGALGRSFRVRSFNAAESSADHMIAAAAAAASVSRSSEDLNNLNIDYDYSDSENELGKDNKDNVNNDEDDVNNNSRYDLGGFAGYLFSRLRRSKSESNLNKISTGEEY